MSIIGVGGIPPSINIKNIVRAIARPVHGMYEGLNFGPVTKGFKVCYIRLSEDLDPQQVVERINHAEIVKKGSKLHAFIPTYVPDLQIAIKPTKLPDRIRRALKIPQTLPRKQLLHVSHKHIMTEMQMKYTILCYLSAKYKHRLLRSIGQEVYDRLVKIINTNPDIGTCFLLTKMYRKRHPHFCDFQLILSTQHQIEDKLGKPRSQLQENELIEVETIDYTDYRKIDSILDKYTEKINQKITAHIEKLKENNEPENDSAEEAARVKVREQLIKMAPYLPGITREVVKKNFMPKDSKMHLVKIYGCPYLPNKEVMAPFVARHRGAGVVRGDMYNLLVLRVHADHRDALLAADGTVLGGAKLVIRPANVKCFTQNPAIFEKNTDTEMQGDAMEVEWDEAW